MIRRASIEGNGGGGVMAWQDGDGSDSGPGHVTIEDSTISGNFYTFSGAAINLEVGSVEVKNTTISGNTSNRSPLSIQGSATFDHVTYVGNVGSLTAGDDDSGVSVKASIVSGSSHYAGFKSRGFNVADDAAAFRNLRSTDVVGQNPLLGPLQNNGGSTLTHAPLDGSPALDAVMSACEEPADQRGVSRPQGGGCDAGSVERACDYDGIVDSGEQCDDGNTLDGDGCSSTCQTELLSGKVLLLVSKPEKPTGAKGVMLSKDPRIALGRGNGSIDDPLLHGGTVRMVGTAGAAFDETYALPAAGWKYIGKPGQGKGYLYKDDGGPIRKAIIRPGKLVKVIGKGAELAHPLGNDPGPVAVFVTIGDRVYCAEYGGDERFRPDIYFRAKDAPAPEAMPLP